MPRAAKVLLIVALASVAILAATTISKDRLIAILEWIRSLGWRGYLVFVLVYVVACIFGLPASPLTFAAPILFGFWPGFVAVTLAANLGAAGAFLIARFLARDWTAAWIKKNP